MTTMSIQLPARSEKIGKFVNRSENCYRLSPITFDHVEKFYTNKNGCVDFDKFETVQELVEYMIDHPSITNYWHTTDELKGLDKIREWIGKDIIDRSAHIYQNGLIIPATFLNSYFENYVFEITLDSNMYDVVKFLQYHHRWRSLSKCITEDDYKYTIRDLICIYYNESKLEKHLKKHRIFLFDGARLKNREKLNRQKEMQEEEATQRKVEFKLQEKMRQEENDQLLNEIDQLRNEIDQLRNENDQLRGKHPITIDASVPWYLQAPCPISTVFGQCSKQISSVHTISTVFGQSTTTHNFM